MPFLLIRALQVPQPTAANATFIAGLYTDDNYAHNTDCDGYQGWYNGTQCASDFTTPGEISNGANASGLPPGLTNGVDALHLYPNPILESNSENDNGRYNGTLEGDANTIRGYINDRTKWTLEDDPVYDITSAFFISNTTVNVTPVVSCTDLGVSISSQSNVSCNGFSDGTATAGPSGGTPPYSYSWSNSATTSSINGVTAGTYNVTVTDDNGCTAMTSVTITQPSALTASISSQSNVSCNGAADGTATAGPSGGTEPYSYSWSNSATTSSINGVTAGTYNGNCYR